LEENEKGDLLKVDDHIVGQKHNWVKGFLKDGVWTDGKAEKIIYPAFHIDICSNCQFKFVEFDENTKLPTGSVIHPDGTILCDKCYTFGPNPDPRITWVESSSTEYKIRQQYISALYKTKFPHSPEDPGINAFWQSVILWVTVLLCFFITFSYYMGL